MTKCFMLELYEDKQKGVKFSEQTVNHRLLRQARVSAKKIKLLYKSAQSGQTNPKRRGKKGKKSGSQNIRGKTRENTGKT